MKLGGSNDNFWQILLRTAKNYSDQLMKILLPEINLSDKRIKKEIKPFKEMDVWVDANQRLFKWLIFNILYPEPKPVDWKTLNIDNFLLWIWDCNSSEITTKNKYRNKYRNRIR